ncbi:MAG TPA: [NiFe]-hydrogenase assembly chaperone HybE [Casimicrobiaceae bacterium]|nr:[NiFe]-hydrogenase assembly chaperone HybE [Casimicrobiaceae bacterium]
MTDVDSPLPDPSPRLEAAFRAVHAERMQGLAFVNAAIGVEAIGFAPWRHYWLGVMLTPWSMNLLLAPRDASAWKPLPPGEKRRYAFPAGPFDFISAREGATGDYLICSLFSPVLEFADHATARQTALLAREALFDPANAEAPELPGTESSRPAPAAASRDAPVPLAPLEADLSVAVSRRDLLHGRMPGRGDERRR